jgi:hypothetical protein
MTVSKTAGTEMLDRYRIDTEPLSKITLLPVKRSVATRRTGRSACRSLALEVFFEQIDDTLRSEDAFPGEFGTAEVMKDDMLRVVLISFDVEPDIPEAYIAPRWNRLVPAISFTGIL